MSATGLGPGAMPAPPGLSANFLNPPNHNTSSIVLHVMCLTLATFAIAIRFFTRAQITHNLGWDDYMALLAWALSASFSGLLLASLQYGFGRHLWDTPAIWLPPLLKLGYAAEIMYLPVALTIKTAFLLFFSRIFAVNNAMKTKWLIYGAIVANAIFYIALIFDTIFFCTPIEKSWNPEIPGHCGNSNAAPIASGVWASLSDFYILILPIYCVWNLQLKRAQKWRLSLVFGFGLLACTASVIRFVYTITLADSPDVTWSLAILSLWSILEIYVGFICCCLPAFLPFFEHTFPNGLGISSYFSRFSSLLSRKGVSTGSTSSSSVPSHSQIIVESKYHVARSNYSQAEEGSGNFVTYNDVNDQVRLAQGDKVYNIRRGPRYPDKPTRTTITGRGYPMSTLK